MKRDEIIGLLRDHQPQLQKAGALHLYLFGSTARGEAKEDSDVDIFIDAPKEKFSLLDLIELEYLIEEILGKNVDAMTRESIYLPYRKQIESSAVRIY